jgi:hypothetical protein
LYQERLDGLFCVVNVGRQPESRTDRSAKIRRWLPVHPAERLSNGVRCALVLVVAITGAEMVVAFGSLQRDAAGRMLPMLESMARLWSRADVNRLRERLVSEPGAVAAFQRALIVDLLFPAAYCGLGVLWGSGAARASRLRSGPWAMFGRVGAWLLTSTFFFDHSENLFLWREIGGGVSAWEPPITWTLHALKWTTGFLGGAAVLASSVGLVGARRPRLNSD